jgi:hypothetical protein
MSYVSTPTISAFDYKNNEYYMENLLSAMAKAKAHYEDGYANKVLSFVLKAFLKCGVQVDPTDVDKVAKDIFVSAYVVALHDGKDSQRALANGLYAIGPALAKDIGVDSEAFKAAFAAAEFASFTSES